MGLALILTFWKTFFNPRLGEWGVGSREVYYLGFWIDNWLVVFGCMNLYAAIIVSSGIMFYRLKMLINNISLRNFVV